MSNNREEKIHTITAEPDSLLEYFRKIFQYKTLIWVFAKRDLKVKYSQTFLGIAWSILQPLTALLIFTFFFSFILKWESEQLPYALYVLSGLLSWNFFSYIVNSGSGSVQEASSIIKKIYFPKSILPLSKVLVAFVELLLSLILLIPLMIYYQQWLSWRLVFFPWVLVFNAICALTLVFWIASFAYKNRDLFHLLPFIITFGIWLTPVFFSNDILPENLQFLMLYNPMANVVNLWRWMLFGHGTFQWMWLINFFIISIFCLAGMYYYNKKESSFADYA